ncbi:hypothetical protein AAG906_020749 [Vitis piasezkii]
MPNHVHRHHADSAATAGPPPSKPNPKLLSFFFLQAIIMTAVISLFFLFVGVAAILLLHICFAGGVFHHRRRRSTPNSGYSAEYLQKLPRFRFDRVEAETARECVVCLEALREGEWCRSLPDCDHIFHSNCVDKWLIKVLACPTCRAPVRFNSGSAGLENRGLKEC